MAVGMTGSSVTPGASGVTWLFITYVLLVVCCLPVSCNDDGDEHDDDKTVTMIIKHGSRAKNVHVIFSADSFITFYNTMCSNRWAKLQAELDTVRGNQARVKSVSRLETDSGDLDSKLFSCVHKATSSSVVCSMLGSDVVHDGVGQTTTECFNVRDYDCPCVGIRWSYQGETLFPDNADSGSVLSRCQPCMGSIIFPVKTTSTKASQTLKPSINESHTLTPSIKQESHTLTPSYKELTEDTEVDKTSVVTIAGIVAAAVCLVGALSVGIICCVRRQRRKRKRRQVTNSCSCGHAEKSFVAESEAYYMLEDNTATPETEDTIKQLTQVRYRNSRDLQLVLPGHAGRKVDNQHLRLPEDKHHHQVDVDDSVWTRQHDKERYEEIDDKKFDKSKDQIKTSITAQKPVPPPTWGEDDDDDDCQYSAIDHDVYENTADVFKNTFKNARFGLQSKNKTAEGSFYSVIDDNFQVERNRHLLQNDSAGKTERNVDNNKINVQVVDVPGKTCDNYEEVDVPGRCRNPRIYSNGSDVNSQLHDTRMDTATERWATPGIGDEDALGKSAYTRLGTGVGKRANPYDVLCDRPAQDM